MEFLLEEQRAAQEELERIEEAVVSDLTEAAKQPREKIAQDHRTARLLERAQATAKHLLEIYEDKNGARKREMDSIGGANEFGEFYKRLKLIKDYHRRMPNDAADSLELEFLGLASHREDIVEELESKFSGEEAFGKYLDMHDLHGIFVNLKCSRGTQMDYRTYLSEFDRFESLPRELKNAEYKSYLERLLEYLRGFFARAKPLFNVEKRLADAESRFETRWEQKSCPGWEDFSSSELFCVACGKQFANQNVFDHHLKGKNHLKNASKLLTTGTQDANSSSNDNNNSNGHGAEKASKEKAVALLEAKISKLGELLNDIREETKDNVIRKQTRTAEEKMMEDVESEPEVEVEDEPETGAVYNPLNLPEGWDGKPIPYWLYKLHGLSVKYECQICGNESYAGRRAFERHFSEWRHTAGLRKLGIPNTRHFQEVTTIADAYSLFDKLKKEKALGAFKGDLEEEYEDSAGNVINKKIYLDLQQQGLL